MKIKRLKGYLTGLSILTLISAGFVETSVAKKLSDKARTENQLRQKARYYFLEGMRHQVEDRHDAAYENFRHANKIDPSFAEAAYNYGQMRLISDVDTLTSKSELNKSLSLMHDYVEQYPEDYDEGLYYAYIASRLDSVGEAIRVYERIDSLLPSRTGILLYLSDAYMASGQDEKALKTLERFEKVEGKSPNLTLKKISYYINRLDTLSAINEATSLVESNTREPGFLILKGNLFGLMNKPDSVEFYLKKAEELAPDYGAAKLALADFYLQQGDTVSYDNKTYEALLAEDFSLEDKTALLSEYLQKLIYDKSDTQRGDYLFSVLENQYPFEPEVLDLAARYNAAKGNFEKAIEKIGYAIDLRSDNEVFWGQKMNYLVSDDRWKEALDTYSEAKQHIDPTPGMKIIYATAAQIGEDYEKAIDMYGEIITDIVPQAAPPGPLDMSVIPSNIRLEGLEQLSGLYTTIGDCSFNEGKKEQAFQSYENALALDPENGMALNNYAYFLTESGGDLEKASEMSKKSLTGNNESNPTFLDTYAWILYKLGKYDEALEYQKRAIEESENNSTESEELWSHYGDILKSNGDLKGADEAWKKASELKESKSKKTENK